MHWRINTGKQTRYSGYRQGGGGADTAGCGYIYPGVVSGDKMLGSRDWGVETGEKLLMSEYWGVDAEKKVQGVRILGSG